MPGVARLDPEKYLGEIKGINIAALSNDGRYLYAADSTLAVVGVIDTQEDRVIKTIRVGQDPWRIYMSHDGRYGITANNGDETISIIDTRTNSVAATLEAGPDMTGINFAAGKALDMNQMGSVTGYEPTIVGSERYDATRGSDVVVITAGRPRSPGMSRDDLVTTNEAIVAALTALLLGSPMVVFSRDAFWRAAATGIAGGALEAAWAFSWGDWWKRRRLRRLR